LSAGASLALYCGEKAKERKGCYSQFWLRRGICDIRVIWTSSEATRDNKLSSYENSEQAESEPDQYKDCKRSV